MVTVERSPTGAVVIAGSRIEVEVLAATLASVVATVPPRVAPGAIVTSARTPWSISRDEMRRDSLIVIDILFVCHQLIGDRR
jgi:hypothetical protein